MPFPILIPKNFTSSITAKESKQVRRICQEPFEADYHFRHQKHKGSVNSCFPLILMTSCQSANISFYSSPLSIFLQCSLSYHLNPNVKYAPFKFFLILEQIYGWS
ncbi:hypothetical protein GDO81_007166 [Engystomops pustulosus]|uniref:Uncharacterized protein n=1 Tax=Engystomops pustulosus TaxID=76066 RepID=A0AAV7C597_ENGPU|nr:hypothetical protein GDO81_007166 [Engystomops pustulosus]